MNIIKIIKRPFGKTGWKIEGNNYTFNNKKLLEVLKNNLLLKNDCLIQFKGIEKNDDLGIEENYKIIIENKFFTIQQACDLLSARIDRKKILIKIEFKYL